MTLAAITLPELAPILTIFVSMLGGFYVLVRFILTQSEKASQADRLERQELSKAIENMARGMQDVATSNARIADESKQRNGHLGELILKQGEQTAQIAESAIAKVIEGVQNVRTQNVIKQNIKTSNVNEEHVTSKE